jgi:KUP system potassium uptake protein
MADWFQPIGIIIATLAAVIASQALISGSFTLIHAIKFLAKSKIEYPTVKGQHPPINWLFLGAGIVLHFEESGNMEHAYGLADNLMHDNDHYFT